MLYCARSSYLELGQALSIQNNISISGLVAQRRNSFGSNKYLRKPECTVVCIHSFTHLAHTHARTHARTYARTDARTDAPAHTLLLLLNSYMFFQTRTKQFSVLRDVRAGSVIGVGVDTHRHLHVLLDGEDLGVAAPDTPLTQPCYAFFDLGLRLKKVCICITSM